MTDHITDTDKMVTYTTLADVVGAMTAFVAHEGQTYWAQGDTLVQAVDDLRTLARARGEKFSIQQLWDALESELGVSRRTFYNRYRTSLIFPDSVRISEGNISWTHHCYAAQTVVVAQPDTWATAHDWLDYAVKGNKSADALKDDIATNKGEKHKADTVYLLKRVNACVSPPIVTRGEPMARVILDIPIDALTKTPIWPEAVQTLVTIMIPGVTDLPETDARLAQTTEAAA